MFVKEIHRGEVWVKSMNQDILNITPPFRKGGLGGFEDLLGNYASL